MDINLRRLLSVISVLFLTGTSARAERFFADDPITAVPPPLPVESPEPRNINELYDFLLQSAQPTPRPPVPAGAVNTLGEVPDSEWFVNRHGRNRMTRDELQRGPGDRNPPMAPYWVVGAKIEGISPGFRMRDARNRLYFVKADPRTNPEMATAADVIGSRIFYALGYYTPETYIAVIRRSELGVHADATVEGAAGRPRPMTQRDLDDILDLVLKNPDGSMRFMASLQLGGEPLGPFKYEGTRRDDPNDIVPHENRRDLRGLHVFCAWLNHTDSKAGNTLDTLVEENGIRFIRHHLLDFGAIFGSDSDIPKDARRGHEFIFPMPGPFVRRLFAFGLVSPAWERTRYPKLKAVGRFEAKLFDPQRWKSNYPNPAFLSRQPDDEYWAATHVMAFSDEDIRALVETGRYSDSAVADYITKVLIERRDRIGRVYLQKVLALDHFRVDGAELRFEDLLVKHGFSEPRELDVIWSRFDNEEGTHEQLAGELAFRLPRDWDWAPDESYYAAMIRVRGDLTKSVYVYLRKRDGQAQIVGIERTWDE